MATKLVTPPASEPLELADAKLFLKIEPDITADDALVTAIVKAARAYCERWTGRAFLPQTWELYLERFPWGSEIDLPYPPLRTVSSVKYTPDGGAQATVPAGDYLVDAIREPGRIVLGRSKSWPADTLVPINGVVVRFEAGYDDAGAIPPGIVQAVRLLLAHWHENREAYQEGTIGREVEFALESLLRIHEVPAFA